jgi:cell division protein FtsB
MPYPFRSNQKNRKINYGILGILTRLVVILLVISVFCAVALSFLPKIRSNQHLRQEVYKLQQEIKSEEATAEHLKASIKAVQEDPKTVERLGRERLGYAKPGESVVHFEPAAAPAGTAAVHP